MSVGPEDRILLPGQRLAARVVPGGVRVPLDRQCRPARDLSDDVVRAAAGLYRLQCAADVRVHVRRLDQQRLCERRRLQCAVSISVSDRGGCGG